VTQPDAGLNEERGATYSVRAFEVGRMDVPGPQVFWMSHWEEWLPLTFHVLLIEGPGVRALVNTGPPSDVGPLNAHVQSVLGERAAFRPSPSGQIAEQLVNHGVDPLSVTHVIITPFTLYTTGGIMSFTNATMCLSRRGWLFFHSTHDHPHDVRHATFSRDVLAHIVLDAWERVRLLDAEDEIAPGLRTWWAGGHHRASLAVEVETAAGVAVASDAFFYRENVTENRVLGISESMEEVLTCYARVRATADHVLPLTDPRLLEWYPSGLLAERGCG
jgi:hypothetical protein